MSTLQEEGEEGTSRLGTPGGGDDGTSSVMGGAEGGFDGADGMYEDPSLWYRWRHHSVPCYIRPPAQGGAGAGQGAGAAAGLGSTLGATALGSTTGAGGGSPGAASTTIAGCGSLGGSPGGGHPTSSGSAAGAAGQTAAQGGAHSTGGAAGGALQGVQALHLNIVTCAVKPDLVLRTELPWVEDKRCHVLDFGPVPVGQRITKPLELFNQVRAALRVCLLSACRLNSVAVFTVSAGCVWHAQCGCVTARSQRSAQEHMSCCQIHHA